MTTENTMPDQPIIHTTGPWRLLCSEDRGGPRCLVVCPKGSEIASINPFRESWNKDAGLIVDVPNMLEVIRELHDFAEPMRHWRYVERGRQAFRDAAILLEKHGG